MKFTVGYQITANNSFIEYIAENKEHIYEMYFSWGDIPNGRNSMLQNSSYFPWQAQQKQIEDLDFISGNGIKLNLLLNGNCYGRNSISRAFFSQIGDTIDYIGARFGLSSVTTTSPLIARFIHENFTGLNVRASVNMKIGTVMGMEYVSEYFDSFYMQREHNRSLSVIEELSDWCKRNNKELFFLANSGCLNNCSAHTFHDNLVAHETDIAQMDNAYTFTGICRDFLKKKEHRSSILKDSSFIRPEDIHLYDKYFTAAKLATRVSKDPIKILRAYVSKKYSGALTDLLEPNHSDLFYPDIIENSKIPADFAEKALCCKKNCSDCDFCANAVKAASITLHDI